MNTIIVTGDLTELSPFADAIRSDNNFLLMNQFNDLDAALSYVSDSIIDFVIVDADACGSDGFEFYDKLKKTRPDMIIFFVTAQDNLARIALQKKADYVIFRPFTSDDINDALNRARLLCSRLIKHIRFHTFGRFDMFVNEKAIAFQNAKAKELLAYLVYRNGAMVPSAEIIHKIWENYNGTVGECSNYRMAVMSLCQTLKEHHIEYLFRRTKGNCGISTEKVQCDYFDFLNNVPDAVCDFQGEFMYEYSWAEDAVFRLIERKRFHKSESKEVSASDYKPAPIHSRDFYDYLTLPVAIIQKDPITGIEIPQYANQAFTDLFEYNAKEDINALIRLGVSAYMQVHRDDAALLRQVISSMKPESSICHSFRLRTIKTKRYIKVCANIYHAVEDNISTYYIVYSPPSLNNHCCSIAKDS